MNERDEVIVALELGRFCAHCVGMIVAAVLLFVGLNGMWDIALNVGWVPLLAIFMFDVMARRHEDHLLTVESKA